MAEIEAQIVVAEATGASKVQLEPEELAMLLHKHLSDAFRMMKSGPAKRRVGECIKISAAIKRWIDTLEWEDDED